MNRALLATLALVSCTTTNSLVNSLKRTGFRAQTVTAFRFGNTVELGEVDETETVAPLAALKLMSQKGNNTATLRIDSPGGSVFVGLRFIRQVTDIKKATGLRVVCVVDGAAYSMAAVILESDVCDVRFATHQSTVLFHNGHGSGPDGTAEQISSAALLLESLNGALAAVVAQRLGITPEDYRSRIAGKDWAMDALGALRAKAIDDIVPQSDIAPVTE